MSGAAGLSLTYDVNSAASESIALKKQWYYLAYTIDWTVA
jgi:hypothetical protein